MPSISHSTIVNVGEDYLESYLKGLGLQRTEDDRGKDLKYWMDSLFEKDRIIIEDLEEFLFRELFWGKRKTIRVYKLEQIKDYREPEDWECALKEHYGIALIDFCNILGTLPDKEQGRKIAAVRSEETDKGELLKIRILFVCAIQINGKSGYLDSIAYIPVELDFKERVMILKAWTRQKVALEEHKAEKLLTHIENLMRMEFGIKTKEFSDKHRQTLFLMSKDLINEAYKRIEAYNKIGTVSGKIKEFTGTILEKLALENVKKDAEGSATLEEGVMDFEGEIRNVIECLVISDYFYQREFSQIWDMDLEAVVTRIKFNDRESVLTSIKGENTYAPIFCTKTFLTLKNRMEETEKTETLWIAMNRMKGNLNLKFDASESRYLKILIRYGIHFKEADLDSALKIYKKYVEKLNDKNAGAGEAAVS